MVKRNLLHRVDRPKLPAAALSEFGHEDMQAQD
jgi:hypothetical protein